MDKVEMARETIQEIKDDLVRYELAAMWDILAEQSRELTWWEGHLRQLLSA